MQSLKIEISSFKFAEGLVSESDMIRITITTLPDGQKQENIFHANSIDKTNLSFIFKSSEQAKNVVVVFRKKKILQNESIIASTVITTEKIPSMKSCKINIYQPNVQIPNLKIVKSVLNQKEIGTVNVFLTYSTESLNINNEFKNKINDISDMKRKLRINSESKENKNEIMIFKNLLNF